MNAEILFVRKASTEDRSESALSVIRDGLAACGVETRHTAVVGCEPIELKRALKTAVLRSDVIAVCGGVGWDAEDRTVCTVCSAIGMRVAQDPAVAARIERAFAGRSLPDEYQNAAEVPADSEVLSVPDGILPGCIIRAASQSMLILPDDPDTLAAMMKGPVAGFFTRDGGFSVTLDEESPETAAVPNVQDGGESAVVPDATADKPIFVPTVAEFYEDDEEAEAEKEPAETDAASDTQEENEPAEDETEPADFADGDDPWNADALAVQADETRTDDSDAPKDGNGEEPSETAEKKEPLLLRAVRYCVPWKGDKGAEIARKLVFLAAVIGLIVSSCYIIDYFADKQHNDNLLSDAREMYDPTDTTVNDDGSLHRFDELLAQNSDCVGWITVPNTKIDNPVYQAADNSYYLNRDATKKYNVYGAVFADYHDFIGQNGNSTNVTLYGHHMKDGTMFANLHYYKKISFYQENPVLTFDTVYGNGGKYKIFACMITNAESKDDSGYYFDYTIPEFENDDAFLSWIEQIQRRSLYITPVDIEPGDEILTLSTCTYEIKGVELRCVVVARKVRAGESNTVDTSAATANTKIIYPAVWYSVKGGSKPSYSDGRLTWLEQPNYTAPIDDPDGSLSSDDVTSSENTDSEAVSSEDTPAASDTPESPQGPGADTPTTPETPQNPDSGSSEAPQTPNSGSSETPQAPDSGSSEAPQAPDSGSSEAPQNPGSGTDAPATPQNPNPGSEPPAVSGEPAPAA